MPVIPLQIITMATTFQMTTMAGATRMQSMSKQAAPQPLAFARITPAQLSSQV